MDIRRLEAQGLIEKISLNPRQVTANLARARKDLVVARANLDIDEAWAHTIAYHAMLRAGRAFMFSRSYRPKGKDQHKTVVEFCGEVLGEGFKTLTNRFNRMRTKRHDFIYEPERPIPKTEAVQSLKSAEEFVEEIALRIEKANGKERLI
jgi:uncharacterized protein (UPF0332 family)